MCFIKHSRCVHNTAHISYIQPILITLVWWFWNSIAKPHGLHFSEMFWKKKKPYQLQMASLSNFFFQLLSFLAFHGMLWQASPGSFAELWIAPGPGALSWAAHALRVDVGIQLCVVGFAWMWYRIQGDMLHIFVWFLLIYHIWSYMYDIIQYILVYMYVYISHHI